MIANQLAGFEVMREAEGLDIFLQARRNVFLVPPKRIRLYFGAEGGKQILNLLQLLTSTRSSTTSAIATIIGRVVCEDAMEQKDDFL